MAMSTSASNKDCKKVFDSKQRNDRLLNLLASTDVEIYSRGYLIIQNTVASCKDTAEKVLETQIMEVLPAIVVKANLEGGNVQPIPMLVKVKVCEKTLEEAHKMNILKTQPEAVIAEDEEEVDIEPWMTAEMLARFPKTYKAEDHEDFADRRTWSSVKLDVIFSVRELIARYNFLQ